MYRFYPQKAFLGPSYDKDAYESLGFVYKEVIETLPRFRIEELVGGTGTSVFSVETIEEDGILYVPERKRTRYELVGPECIEINDLQSFKKLQEIFGDYQLTVYDDIIDFVEC